MANLTYVLGLGTILRNLAIHQASLGLRFRRGAIKAGLTLQRESQGLVPVEYGPLKNSAFTRALGQGMGSTIVVGYTAAYAVYVHEAAGTLRGQPRPSGVGRYWDPIPKAQPKFLEEPARTNAQKMRKIILTEMKI